MKLSNSVPKVVILQFTGKSVFCALSVFMLYPIHLCFILFVGVWGCVCGKCEVFGHLKASVI